MAIILCPQCNKRMITQRILDAHLAKSHPATDPLPQSLTSENTSPATPEPIVETPAMTEKITLRFSAPIEVSINSVHYFGTVVEAPNMAVATEIVRIAKEAYGRGILLN